LSTEFKVTGPRVIVALDFPTANEALTFATRLSPQQCRVKVGFELFTSAGPAVVDKLVEKGFDVFLDLKYHDIPNTVASACAAAARLGVWMLNVHTLGGRNMMQAAREAVDKATRRPLLIGVTVLTSHSADDLHEIGFGGDTTSQVLRLAHLAKQSGLDGVVCSALEAPQLRQDIGSDLCFVTPGIRPFNSTVGDQQRIMTPTHAIQAGAHYLVIGRPITQASDPLAVLATIDRELRSLV
jgi:orotidine-5'-phosphate decarboxylase